LILFNADFNDYSHTRDQYTLCTGLTKYVDK